MSIYIHILLYIRTIQKIIEILYIFLYFISIILFCKIFQLWNSSLFYCSCNFLVIFFMPFLVLTQNFLYIFNSSTLCIYLMYFFITNLQRIWWYIKFFWMFWVFTVLHFFINFCILNFILKLTHILLRNCINLLFYEILFFLINK